MKDRTFILSKVFTSENSVAHLGTNIATFYPLAAGTEEGVIKTLEKLIKEAKDSGLNVEEIDSLKGMGSYFDKLIKITGEKFPQILGIHSVWSV